MLRITRLRPGQRALLPQAQLSTSPTAARRQITFVTGKGGSSMKPFTFLGEAGNVQSSPPTPRKPSRWTPSTISTLAFGSLLVGSWYIWEEGRSYQVAAEAERHAPHDLGTHREGTVNRDYVNYERWVERHGRK